MCVCVCVCVCVKPAQTEPQALQETKCTGLGNRRYLWFTRNNAYESYNANHVI